MSAAVLFAVSLVTQEGDPAQAVVALQAAIQADPGRESNYTDLGNVLLRTQNFAEAAVILEAAKSRFPKSAQVMVSLGVAYYGQRRFPDSVTALMKAAQLDPDAPQPVMFLDRMAEHTTGKEAELKSIFATYARRNPQDPLGHLALGRLNRDATELRRAIALNPRLAEAHLELGIALESSGDYPGATASLQRAAQLSPKNPVPHFRLARLYARAGKDDSAAAERALHKKLAAEEQAELDRRQAATRHLDLKVSP